MPKTAPFDNHLFEYEQWFVKNYYAYLSELEAIRQLLPGKGTGTEIGVGSGIFASALAIKQGCDPSAVMRKKAAERDIQAIHGVAEDLPYESGRFDFTLMVTTICFVDDPGKSLSEITRILKPDGIAVIAFVDKDSPLGKMYLRMKQKSLFYKDAVFFSTPEIYALLKDNNLEPAKTLQTVFGSLDEIREVQLPAGGYGKGSFIVVRAEKNQ